MKTAKHVVILATFLLGFCYTQASIAGSIIFGPFPDFRGFVNVTNTVNIPTSGRFTIHIPFDGNLSISFRDNIAIRVTHAVPIFTASYIKLGIVGDPQLEPDALLTDIYALDLDGSLGGPDGDVPLLTGFDPGDPQITPLSPEEFITNTGGVYTSSLAAVRLGDLATLLPEYDLSRFTGNPDLIVYLAQATVPLADIVIPEPATLALFGIGIAACLLFSRRRKAGLPTISLHATD